MIGTVADVPFGEASKTGLSGHGRESAGCALSVRIIGKTIEKDARRLSAAKVGSIEFGGAMLVARRVRLRQESRSPAPASCDAPRGSLAMAYGGRL